jgi:hypothetical protein
VPIYEYQCKNPLCDEPPFEKLVIGSETAGECPVCATLCKKVMSPSNGFVRGKYTAKTGYSYFAQNEKLGG